MSGADRARWTDLDGPVHHLDYGGPADGPLVVCVHGLGGSAVNWSAVAPFLTERCRVVAPDLAGHGRTRALGRGTDVAANRLLLHRFLATVSGGPVILMGNSMGAMISLLEAAASPSTVAGLVLVDPVLPLTSARPDPLVAALFAAYTTPGLGRLVLRRRRGMTPEAAVAETLSLSCVDRRRIAPDVVAEHVAVARERAGHTDTDRHFLAAARSVIATAGYTRGRPYGLGLRTITAPVLLVHGERDRLVPVAAARLAARTNPSWAYVELDGVGHVPQLEDPQRVAGAFFDWLDSVGETVVSAAGPRPPGGKV